MELRKIFRDFRSFNFSLFFSLCALSLVPAVYMSIRTFLISVNTSTQGIDVIGQMEWFDLIDETIRAFLIIPLYSILNKIFKNDKLNFPYHVFKTGVITILIYAVFSIIVFIYGLHLVGFMNPNSVDIAEVFSYLRLETIAFMIGIIMSFINVVFVVIGKAKNVYIFMIVQIILGILTDFIFIPNFGVNGVAISNIITNSIVAVVGIIVLRLEGFLKLSWFKKDDLANGLTWAKVGLFSGGQQFVDNIVYALMIGKMVNMVAEQGNYWSANNFIWGWLLIPIAALAEVIRHDCKDGYFKLKQKNYYLIVFFSVLLWTITIPVWIPFFKNVQQLENFQAIYSITIKLTPFYIAYGLTIVPDSIFIGMGKTIYSLICSLIVNFLYYGTFFVLYLNNAITFNMDTIILMFGFGMVIHWVISTIEEKRFLRIRALKERDHNKELNIVGAN